MPASRLAAILRTLHWRRGLRAGFAVASAMIVCRLLNKPMGWAALGGFESVLVDNGGPYRSRMNTIAAVLLGGALCAVVGTLVPQNVLIAAIVTAAMCFTVTFARVASQPIASTAVVILVIYFAGFGATDRTLYGALANTTAYILGGLWAATIGLFLWPVDPFRPARLEVAACCDLLADFTASLHVSAPTLGQPSHDADRIHTVDFKRHLRSKLESAHAALRSTAARAPVRTHRARNLSVLLETADLIFAATVRLTELAEVMPAASETLPTTLDSIAKNLSGAERAIADGLRTRPADNAASFAPKGSHRLQYVLRPAALLQVPNPAQETNALQQHLLADQRDALQNIEIAFDAIRAVWTGADPRITAFEPSTAIAEPSPTLDWLDAIRQNWTLDSIMMRHALRMAVIGAVDVLLMNGFHISHGFWLAMTSIIVLQPYGFGTVRRSAQRVAGTAAGGILAAILAATIHSYAGIIIVITIGAVLASGKATYIDWLRLVQLFLTHHRRLALTPLTARDLAIRRHPHRYHASRSSHRRHRHARALAAEPQPGTRPPA